MGIPFEIRLPEETHLAYAALTKERFGKEIGRRIADVKPEDVYSADTTP